MSEWKYNTGSRPVSLVAMSALERMIEVELMDGQRHVGKVGSFNWSLIRNSETGKPRAECIERWRYAVAETDDLEIEVDFEERLFEECRWLANNKGIHGMQAGKDEFKLPWRCRFDVSYHNCELCPVRDICPNSLEKTK